MMTDKAKEFILGLGAMTEMWMIAYNNFRNQGLNHTEAMEHTSAFMKVTLTSLNGSTNEKTGGKD